MSAPRLIVGLGNPTDKHVTDRHNAGFWFIDELARQFGGQLRHDPKFQGDVGEARIGSQLVRLLKPSTWMNRSGQAVGGIARFYRLEPTDILVVYDELDLLPGSVRLKLGGSSTHNGLRDITAHLGGPRYWRLRIGIGHPRTLNLEKTVVDFVLSRPSQPDRQAIEEAIERSLRVLPELIDTGNWEITTQKLHSLDPHMQAKAASKAAATKPSDYH
ncbi:MAG: aminoacyl-tRNA hydrolase [Lautropia sp.]|nr:aminoacyl-tRNA hydrolase [Lautropia sp.]